MDKSITQVVKLPCKWIIAYNMSEPYKRNRILQRYLGCLWSFGGFWSKSLIVELSILKMNLQMVETISMGLKTFEAMQKFRLRNLEESLKIISFYT